MLEVLHYNLQYLVSDLDEQQEDDEHKQVVNDADSSDDDVDDLECNNGCFPATTSDPRAAATRTS